MKKYLKYLVTTLIGLFIVLLVLISKDIFVQTEKVKIFHILSDAFLVPSVLFIGFGLLVVASNGGAFDMLVFGTRLFFGLFKPALDNERESFYEYRQRKHEDKKDFWFLLVVGIVFLIITLIMYYFYTKFYV